MAAITASELKARFPVFESSADAVVTACIEDASRSVGAGWRDTDVMPATILLAAHYLVTEGAAGSTANATETARTRRRKIGEAEVEWHPPVDAMAPGGDLNDTAFGRRFLELERRNLAGPALTG